MGQISLIFEQIRWENSSWGSTLCV